MFGSRWLAVLTLVALIALGATAAQAQVFRPRSGKAAPVSKAALTAAAPAASKKTGASDASPPVSSKKTARPGEARRPGPAGPAGKKKRGKARGDSDTVVIDDDDDDDVKITDD